MVKNNFFLKSKKGHEQMPEILPGLSNSVQVPSKYLTLKDVERKLRILNARFDGKFYVELDAGRFKLKWEGLR